MFLCGYSTEEMLEKKLPLRLMERGVNASFIFATYAMLEMKDNDSALLAYGYYKNENEPRAWTEYMIGRTEHRVVCDYCSDWVRMTYTKFHNELFPETSRVYLDYIFWTKYTSHLHSLIQKPETSYILDGLVALRPQFRNGSLRGFINFDLAHPDRITGRDFIPTVILNPDGSPTLLTRELFDSLMQ